MKVAVTDACIFIEILELEIADFFFDLPIHVHTSLDIWSELHSQQQEILNTFCEKAKLIIHTLDESEQTGLINQSFPKSLSAQDKTVIFLAEKLEAMILSSDKPVRSYAKSHSIEYHGLLWILDQLVTNQHITSDIACQKLSSQVERNLFYQNNPKLLSEVKKRMAKWCGE
ncbi:MAG: hypothetical protein JJE25_15135 [Bacteroidia bacterium]|nr:hypothetical protein [Bacteroidia bacterium]